MCGFVEFGGIACVVVAVGAAAPVMACRGQFQAGFLNARGKFDGTCRHWALVVVIAEIVTAKPQLVDVDVRIIRRAFQW